MTHRSRAGGPPRNLGGRKPYSKKKGPKLHHPPAADKDHADRDAGRASSESEPDGDDSPLPAAAFEKPSDTELLTVLRFALASSLDSPDFMADVQRAKSLLFAREWLTLFTDAKLLGAYAGRWVPPRALCFREMMASLRGVRELFTPEKEEEEEEEEGEEEKGEGGDEGKETTDQTRKPTKPARHILSIGGGAGSELLAVAALASASGTRIRWTGADIGAWGGVLSAIEGAVRDRWEVDAEFAFVECDVLAPPAGAGAPTTAADGDAKPAVRTVPGPPPFLAPLAPVDLTTIFFTLTELLSQSRARTLALLRGISDASAAGSYLLVADSASDIAEFPLGKEERTWPVYMVLDALMNALGGWERVRAQDSRWFRLGEVVWPCKLENCRYWIRMYRKKCDHVPAGVRVNDVPTVCQCTIV